MNIEGSEQLTRSTVAEGLFADTAGCGDVGHSQQKDTQDVGPDVRPRREVLERLHELDMGRAIDANGEDFRRYEDIRPRVRQPDVEGIQIPHLGGQNKRPKVMPDQFDGKSSWTDYIAHFEICCEINGWTPPQRAQYLSVSLRGSACQVLGTLPIERRRDYRELVRALGRRFNPENQSELYRVQLRNRGRKVNESLPELGQQIRTLVAQAYPILKF